MGSYVTVTINERNYRMACDEGEEEKLHGLAERVDKIAKNLRASFGEIGDQRLITMTAIMLADKLGEAESRLEAAGQEISKLKNQEQWLLEKVKETELKATEKINEAAQMVDKLSDQIS